MTLYTLTGEIPRHQYIWVDVSFTHANPPQNPRFIPAVWFGIVSYPGRAWGLNVLLESGAVYRNLPPHAIAFDIFPPADGRDWNIADAQTWDCYGRQFSTIEYTYLATLDCRVRAGGKEYDGSYLFTVTPIGDAFSAAPEQAKEFTFIRLENERLTIQPTNHIIYRERSFTVNERMEFPGGLKRQMEVYSCE